MQPSINLDSQPQKSARAGLISVGCFICSLPFFCVVIVVLSLIPIYVNHANLRRVSAKNSPSFSVAYLVLNGDTSSLTSLSSIDQRRTIQSLNQGLGLSTTAKLQLQSLSQDTVIGTSRRKRYIRCDHGLTTVNGTGLIFQFYLSYPLDSVVCRDDNCKNNQFAKVYQRFQTVSLLSVELAGKIVTLELCSLGIVSFNFSTHNFWQSIPNMSTARYYPTSTVSLDGNSVIVSGSSSIYDYPSTSLSTVDTFRSNSNSASLASTRNLSIIRNFHTTNRLPQSNLILFAGGINATDGTKLNSAEVFNSTAGTSILVSMSSIRFDHQSVSTANSSNQIILIGGTDSNGLAMTSGDVFNGNTFTSVLNQMTIGRRYHTVTYLPTINKIFIAGGETVINCSSTILTTVELYNIQTNMFENLAGIQMSSARFLHTATYIPSPYNQVLILGGSSTGTNTLNTYDIFDVASLSFTRTGTVQSAHAFHTATLLTNNASVLIVGGFASNEAINVSYQPMAPCEIFNMTTMSSSLVANMNTPRAFHTATLLPNTNGVLCCGGVNSNNAPLASCELYTP